MSIWEEAKEIQEELVRIRRELHQHPGLSWQEFDTAKIIEGNLIQSEIPYQKIGETAILGEIKGLQASERTVLLRADIDALPIEEETGLPFSSQNQGVMHACGHDLHTAALIGAGKILLNHRNDFGGTVLLAFQPAEEKGQGFRSIIDAIEGRDIDRVFGIHITPDYRTGDIVISTDADAAAVDIFDIDIKGKSAHIASPEKAADALLTACRIVTELKSLTNRVLNPFEKALIGIGMIQSGTARNIIPQDARVSGTIRTFSSESRKTLLEAFSNTIENVSQQYGTDASIHLTNVNGPVIHREKNVKEAFEIFSSELNHNSILRSHQPSMGFAGDDFSEYLDKYEGIYAHVGCADPADEQTSLPLHNSRFAPDEKALPTMAAAHVAYAIAILNQLKK